MTIYTQSIEVKKDLSKQIAWLYNNNFIDFIHDVMYKLKEQRESFINKSKTYWDIKDDEISPKIISAIKKLKSILPPVRLTKCAIINEIGVNSRTIKANHEKLPKTRAAFIENMESEREFIIRRLDYIMGEMDEKGLKTTKTNILLQAHISCTQENKKILLEYLENKTSKIV